MSRYDAVLFTGLTLLVFGIYAHTLEAPFVFDDYTNIQTNPAIRLQKLTLEDVTRAVSHSYLPGRPIANLSFALNYYFGQYNVTGYHLVNIMLHLATGIILYFFVQTTLPLSALPYPETTLTWIARLTVLLWLVHPLHTQSVTYIVQRMNSLAALFYLLSLLLYARGRLATNPRRRWWLWAGCLLAGLLALGSKEIALTLPGFLALYEWYFFQDVRRIRFKRAGLALGGGLGLCGLVVWLSRGTDALHRWLFVAGDFDFTVTERVLTEFRVVVVYLKLLLWPHPSQLNIDYDFPLSYSLFTPITTLLAMVAVSGMLGLAVYLARRERLLSFCILWFFGNLLIESSVIMLDIVFEHRTYLPSMLFSLFVVMLVVRYSKVLWPGMVGLCAVAIVYSVWTYERNSLWASEVTLWRDCVEKSPHKARPHTNLGYALARQGNLTEAVQHYREALRIAPNYALAHNNLGDALARQGQGSEAIRHYMEALRLRPDYAEAHNNWGNALMDAGQVEIAIQHYTEAVRLLPDSALFHNNLGSALARQSQLEAAMRHYTEALRLQPDSAQVYNNLGNALARQGHIEAAVRAYTEALRLNPNYTLARTNLERVRRQSGASASPSRTAPAP